MRRWLLALAIAVVASSMATASASAYSAPGPRWPGGTIRFHESLPKSYNWSLKKAVKTWNTSGVRIKFRKVKKRAKAQVTVGFGQTNGYQGYASVGYQPRAFVHLAGRGRLPKENRVSTGMIIAHELGHVMGLDHTKPGGCRLMEAVIEYQCYDARPGFYRCRWLSKDDVRGALRLYGGKAKRLPKKNCLLEPRPPALDGVRITGGEFVETPLTVDWSVPKGVRKGSKVSVGLYDASRCSGDKKATQYYGDEVPVRQGRWSDSGYADEGSFCVEARIVNKYGLAGPPTRIPLTRTYQPTPPPLIGDMVEYPDYYNDYVVEASVSEGAYLAVTYAPSGRCVTDYAAAESSGVVEGGFAYADEAAPGRWWVSGVPPGRSCLSFFAVAFDGGPSGPVTREIDHVDRPAE
jgi:hypothetical protein